MNRIFKPLLSLFVVLLVSSPAVGQFITIDWGLHSIGQVTELVNNRGSLHGFAVPEYPGLINAEFPPGSFVEHHAAVAPFYASLSKNKQDTMVTTVRIFEWNSENELSGFSSAPWDTVHEVRRGDTVDIGDPTDPYYPNYVSHADEDFITRYNDYNESSLRSSEHNPMFIDIYQRSWAWASAPMDQFIIFNLDVIPKRKSLYDFWTGIYFNPEVGLVTGNSPIQDDYVTSHPSHNMVIAHDAPGNEGPDPYTPMGLKIMPPPELDNQDLEWTFQWGGTESSRDPGRYEEVSSGEIQSNQTQPLNTQAIISFGMIDSLTVGDTLKWKYATVYGFTEKEVLQKSRLIDQLYPDFAVPSPPPSPEVTVTPSDRQIKLTWGSESEDFVDPNRSDSIDKPFEGYRVYKSTRSASGPWTLLAEYDLAGNEFGLNTGLEREYTDTGLMNNVEYYYAVTAFSKPDTVLGFPSQESSQRGNALEITPGTEPPDDVGQVAVVPNPYRGDIDYNDSSPPWERPDPTRQRWLEQDRRIQFINLPRKSTVKIYTLSGRLVETLRHESDTRGFEDWNLTSKVNQAVASGIYLFTVKNEETGNTQTGKFVIIK